MTTETQTLPDVLQFIRCYAAGAIYCLDMKWVESIERIDHLDVLAHTEHGETGFLGMMPGAGGGVPVYSLAARLGLSEETAGETQRVVVLNSGGKKWGLRVRSVSQVTKVGRDAFAPLPAIAHDPANVFFGGMIKTDESLLLLLAPERLAPGTPDTVPTALDFDDTVDEIGWSSARTRQEADSTTQANTSSSPHRILVFSLAEPAPHEHPLVFGLSVTQVPEVLNLPSLIPVPGAPPSVMGIARWRGSPVPVIDLAARLGLPPVAARSQTRLMISCGTKKSSLLGFLIQPTVRSIQLPVAHRPCKRNLGLDETLLKGVVELQNETLVVPDIQRLLG